LASFLLKKTFPYDKYRAFLEKIRKFAGKRNIQNEEMKTRKSKKTKDVKLESVFKPLSEFADLLDLLVITITKRFIDYQFIFSQKYFGNCGEFMFFLPISSATVSQLHLGLAIRIPRSTVRMVNHVGGSR